MDGVDGRMLKALGNKYGNVYIQEYLSAQSNDEKTAVILRLLKDNLYSGEVKVPVIGGEKRN